MAKFIGRLVDVGIGKELVRGAGVAASFWMPKSNITFDDKINKARPQLGYGNIGIEGDEALVAQRWAEGDLETVMTDKSFGLLLLALFGTVNTTGPSSGVYTHTFSLQNDASHDSLAITVVENGQKLMFPLAMIESMTINCTPDDVVRITVSFMAKQADGTTGTATYTAENKFAGRHVALRIASLTSGLNAASKMAIRSLTLRIEKRLRPDWVLGTVEPVDFNNQAFSIEGDVELTMEDRSNHDIVQAGTYKALRLSIINDQVTIGVGSDHPEFVLELSKVDFDEWESARPNDEIASETFTFRALYDMTNGNIINSCTLKNTQSTY